MVQIDITNLKIRGEDRTIGQALDELVEAETDNFAELMKIMNLDPAKDLRFADLSDVDLTGCDIAGWDFTGSNLSGADLRKATNVQQAIFSEKTRFDRISLPENITIEQLIK